MLIMKTGLFFGSFNPIHVGHLVLANYMAEFTDLKEIWFVVSPQNPHKEKSSLLAAHQRLHMVNLAIAGFPKFKSSNIEFSLSQPSYTVNTLAHLKEKYPRRQFSLILGADNLTTFHKWKNSEQIIQRHQLYIYPRPGVNIDKYMQNPQVVITSAPQMDISSTFIRQAIKDKKNVCNFMTQTVWQYIQEMHFYEK